MFAWSLVGFMSGVLGFVAWRYEQDAYTPCR